jgi:Holliday junction resolvase RusA-like endonuclease
MTPTSSITIRIHRTNLLTSNQRHHYRVIAERTHALRALAKTQAQTTHPPRYERAFVTAWVSWPNRSRTRDVWNLGPTIKACIDGLTDAGLWDDDDDTRIVGPLPLVTRETSGTPNIITLRFEIRALPPLDDTTTTLDQLIAALDEPDTP